MTMIIDNAYHVVFDPTAEDWEASNETTLTAQKDAAQKRWWLTLTKEAIEAEYTYKGKGKYTGGPIADIPSIYMTPDELAVLAATWRYTPMVFDIAKTITDFQDSEANFKKCFLYLLEFCMLQVDATAANIALAHVALATTLTALNSFDYDNAYLLLKVAATTTSFTQEVKDNMIGYIENYLKMYPR